MLKKIKFYFKRMVLKRKLKIESRLVSQDSMKILHEFEEIN